MKAFRTLYIGIAAAVLCSCIQEVKPEGEHVRGMWAMINEQSQSKKYIRFEGGYMTTFTMNSSSELRTVAEGQIWHASEREYRPIERKSYSISAEGQLFLSGEHSGEIKIDGNSMIINNQKALLITGFNSERYSSITTNIVDNRIYTDVISRELEFDYAVTNPIPNSSVQAVVSPAGMADVRFSQEGKMTVVLPEVSSPGMAEITLVYPGAEDLVIYLVRERATMISVSKTVLDYDYTGQSVTIPFMVDNLISGESVKAVLSNEGSSWIKDITVSPTALNFRLEENNDSLNSKRTASITLSTRGALDVTISIIQRYTAPSLSFSLPSSFYTDYAARTISPFKYVVSNPRTDGFISLSCSSSWITNLKDDKGIVTLDVAENNSGSSRTANIVVKYSYGVGNSVSKSYPIYQTYSSSSISFTPASQSTDYTAKSLSFKYSISNPRQGVTASASTTDAWITDVQINGTTVSYKVAENSSVTSRTGKIELTYGSTTNDFAITQDSCHEYVDLGLSVKWATCNVGASNPEDYGGYYQWAGTKDVTDRSIDLYLSNCPYHTGSSEYTGWTKYVSSGDSSYWSGTGGPDNKTVLDPSDDVAHVEWGSSWRMPTNAEWTELRNTNNCSWTWTSINGINGYKVQSKKPGYTANWIFLPAAGYRDYIDLYRTGSYGYYWSSSLSTDDPSRAYDVYFSSGSGDWFINRRYYGQSVRPVSE